MGTGVSDGQMAGNISDSSSTTSATEKARSLGRTDDNILALGRKASNTVTEISRATQTPKSRGRVNGSKASASDGLKMRKKANRQISEGRLQNKQKAFDYDFVHLIIQIQI